MVALLLTTMSMTGSIGLLVWIIQAGAHSGNMTEAVTLGQNVIDELRDQDYSTMASGSDSVGDFARSWTVTQSNAVKAIDVTVSWNNRRGRSPRILLSTVAGPDN
jgi:Tfp pilus assembly protein PilV